MTLTVVNGGSASGHCKVVVSPHVIGNFPTEKTMVRVDASGSEVINTGGRLRTNHLISLGSTSSRSFYGATKSLGVWSEWSAAFAQATSAFSAGSNQKSIGELQDDDLHVEEPGIVFPDFNVGTGKMEVFRTLVSDGAFLDETRRQKGQGVRVAFTVKLTDLEPEQILQLNRFFQSINGVKPFVLEFSDPDLGQYFDPYRYVARLRDPTVASELEVVDRGSVSFDCIEASSASYGGNI